MTSPFLQNLVNWEREASKHSKTKNQQKLSDILDEFYSLAWQDGYEKLNRRSKLNDEGEEIKLTDVPF